MPRDSAPPIRDLVPDSRAIREAPHAFLTALATAGAKVVHPDAARLAEHHRLPLELYTLTGSTPATVVHADANGHDLRAVATRILDDETAEVTAVAGIQDDPHVAAELLRAVLDSAGVEIRDEQTTAQGPSYVVGASHGRRGNSGGTRGVRAATERTAGSRSSRLMRQRCP